MSGSTVLRSGRATPFSDPAPKFELHSQPFSQYLYHEKMALCHRFVLLVCRNQRHTGTAQVPQVNDASSQINSVSVIASNSGMSFAKENGLS